MSDGRRSKWNCIIRRGHDLAAFWNGLPLIFFFRCCPSSMSLRSSSITCRCSAFRRFRVSYRAPSVPLPLGSGVACRCSWRTTDPPTWLSPYAHLHTPRMSHMYKTKYKESLLTNGIFCTC